MADEFVPYPDMPGEPSRSNAALAVDRSKAQWAKTFEGGTTNLATRARQSQDVKAYAENLEQRRVEESAKRLATDKDAQNFYLRSKALQLNEEKTYFDMEDKKRKAEAATQMAPLMFQAKEAETRAKIANTARVAKESAAKARMDEETDLFHAAVAEASMDYAPDSPEYDQAIISAATKHWMAARDPAAKSLIESARKQLGERATQAKKDAAAIAAEKAAMDAGLVKERISPAGTTFAAPPTPRAEAAPRATSRTGPDFNAKADSWEEKAMKVKGNDANATTLRNFYNEKALEAKGQAAANEPRGMGDQKSAEPVVRKRYNPATGKIESY